MKMMFCHGCGSLVVPSRIAENPKWCECRSCAVWWNDPRAGTLTVFGPSTEYISVIGLNNSFLTRPFQILNGHNPDRSEYGCMNKDDIKNLIEECPQGYLFKTIESNVIRVRADFHGVHGLTLLKDESKIPSVKWPDSSPEQKAKRISEYLTTGMHHSTKEAQTEFASIIAQ